jgi:chromosomal replication initiation ATPase DnaA
MLILRPPGEAMRRIREIVAAHQTTLEAIQGKGRAENIVMARWEVCIYLRSRHWSSPSIGAFLNKDHSTVLHALRHKVPSYARSRATELQQRNAGLYPVAGHDPAPPAQRRRQAAETV